MKGLILKDLLNLCHYKISLIMMLIIVIVISFSQQSFLTYIPIMLITMVGMIGLSTFNYDEIAKSDKYLLSLPTSKKEIVKAKYILSICMILLGAILAIIITVIISFIMNKINPELWGHFTKFEELGTLTIGGVFGVSLVTCIQIPSIYKWGAERGRIQMFILIIAVMGVIGGIIFLLSKSGLTFDFGIITPILKNLGIAIAIIITLLMYYISYKISCRIYKNKEI